MALSNHIDIRRHKQFRKDVDDLKNADHIRRYTAEISQKTGETTGNISNYYNGRTPIGNNFLKKFKKAYGRKLKKIREPEGNLPIALNIEIQPPSNDLTDIPPNTDTTPPDVSESEQFFPSSFEQFVAEKLADIKASLTRLEQKLDKPPKPPRKKK